jgi:hypothetical protein
MSQYLALREQLLQPQSQPQPIPQPQPQPQPPLDPTTTAAKNSWGISSETLLKLAELKSRLYQHSYTFPNFDIIYQGAKHFAMIGDDSVLDERLAFFRSFDVFNGNENRINREI